MKLKYTFETMELDDQIIAVPVGTSADEFKGVIRLNETANRIFELLQTETDEAAIIQRLQQEFTGTEESIQRSVHDCITNLYDKGLVE